MTLRDERPPDDDPSDLAQRLSGLIRKYPEELTRIRTILAPLIYPQPSRPKPEPVPVPQIDGEFPKATLAAKNQGGVLLSPGQICLLSAEGGVGKSALTAHIALATAMLPENSYNPELHQLHQLQGGVFDGAGGTVLMATYEDPPPVTRWRMMMLAESLDAKNKGLQAQQALERVYVLNMSGWTVYGPPEHGGYSARPAPLAGWNVLWEAVELVKPKLIILDPVLKAYAGEPNTVSPVREFLGDLAGTALERSPGAGIILVAHSTKAARSGRQDPFDPGQVAGSGAWADECRGVMTMTWNEETDQRTLAIPKSNWGPSRIMIDLQPMTHANGAVIGFQAHGEWQRRTKQLGAPRETDTKTTHKQDTMKELGEEYAGIGR